MLTNTEKMVMDRFLSKLPEGFKPKPIVHIIQVVGRVGGAVEDCGCCC